MKDISKKLYNDTSKGHKYLLNVLEQYRAETRPCSDAYEQVDNAYALREAIALLEHLIKEYKKDERMSWAKAGFAALAGDVPEKLGTYYCNGTVKFKQIPEIPRKGQEGYEEFFEFFGVDPKYLDLDLFRLQWKNFIAFHNERLAAGEPEIPGIDVRKTAQKFELAIRKKNQIEFS